jgi:hypothetical protein
VLDGSWRDEHSTNARQRQLGIAPHRPLSRSTDPHAGWNAIRNTIARTEQDGI